MTRWTRMEMPDQVGWTRIGIGVVVAIAGEQLVHGSTALVIVVYWLGVIVGMR